VEEEMDTYVVRSSDGKIVAAAEVVQPSIGLSSAEPQLEDGQEVEIVKTSSSDLSNVESFFASQR
jgi:hypothetical protein